MKKFFAPLFCLLISVTLILSACSQPATTAQTSEGSSTDQLVVYAPASTSSIPVIIAVNKMGNAKLVLYSNQSQANTIFLRGEAPIMVTGLSVGIDLFKNDAPVQIANSYVSGVSHLVTYKQQVTSLAELKGRSVYIPFEGSPIEEVMAYFAKQEGLEWKKDITPIYLPFDASVALLKEGKLDAVVLPEPMVSLVENQSDVFVSLSLYDLWNKYDSKKQGYPQVGTFVNSEWAKTHPEIISTFNTALTEAIDEVQKDPSAAVEAVKDNFKIPAPKLITALGRTQYKIETDSAMMTSIDTYYKVIGKPLDEKFSSFYYITSK